MAPKRRMRGAGPGRVGRGDVERVRAGGVGESSVVFLRVQRGMGWKVRGDTGQIPDACGWAKPPGCV